MGPDVIRMPRRGGADPLAALWRIHACGRSDYGPGQHYHWDNRERPTRDVVILQRTVSGLMRHRDHRGSRLVQPGTLLLMRHGEPSSYGDPPAGYACRWIEIAGAGLDGIWEMMQRRHGPLVPSSDPIDRILDRLQEIRQDLPPPVEAAAVAAAVFALVAELESHRNRSREPVDNAIDRILVRPLAVDSIASLCREHGVSREHLARRFRVRTGGDARSWLARRRAEEGALLLRGTDLTAIAVAMRVGYASVRALRRAMVRAGLPSPGRARE